MDPEAMIAEALAAPGVPGGVGAGPAGGGGAGPVVGGDAAEGSGSAARRRCKRVRDQKFPESWVKMPYKKVGCSQAYTH